ncbi:hypothetical protein [Lentzea sp. NPDC051838]|uniref:hypothetical protein n=1 Tax=Lentzea sp. NPDC051838 TaxID=3154849 RepID=UPI00343897B7
MPRSWNEIDWDADVPDFAEIVASRDQIVWSQVPVTEPALEPLLRQLAATHVNGGYLLARFRAVAYPDATAWYLSRNRFADYHFLRFFFSDAVVREGLRDLKIPEKPDDGSFEEQWAGSLCLDGLLAGLIVNGGAYKAFDGPAREAKAIATAAVEALTQNRFEDFRVDISHAPWTPWFHDIAWDITYVLTDLANAEVTVLCVTDTD